MSSLFVARFCGAASCRDPRSRGTTEVGPAQACACPRKALASRRRGLRPSSAGRGSRFRFLAIGYQYWLVAGLDWSRRHEIASRNLDNSKELPLGCCPDQRPGLFSLSAGK